MNRFDLISPRPRKDGETHWQKIGAAFPRDKGGFTLVFNALPLPDAEGRVTVLMTEPKPKRPSEDPYSNASQGGEHHTGQGGAGTAHPFDDEIPF